MEGGRGRNHPVDKSFKKVRKLGTGGEGKLALESTVVFLLCYYTLTWAALLYYSGTKNSALTYMENIHKDTKLQDGCI